MDFLTLCKTFTDGMAVLPFREDMFGLVGACPNRQAYYFMSVLRLGTVEEVFTASQMPYALLSLLILYVFTGSNFSTTCTTLNACVIYFY
eukprot:m.42574 g.42574  ORF g.42574 m.42574 type:complete len:90 (-) comp9893_c0_seq2:208-477(-)